MMSKNECAEEFLNDIRFFKRKAVPPSDGALETGCGGKRCEKID